MEAGREKSLKEIQIEETWIPKTPFKPILPKPQVAWPGSEGSSSDFIREARASIAASCLGYPGCHIESAYGVTRVCAEACKDYSMNGADNLQRMSFQALMDLAHTASGASHRALGLNPMIPSCHTEEPQCGYTRGPAYDLNFAPGIMQEESCSDNACQFVPVTPNKAMNDHVKDAGMQHVCTTERQSEEINTEASKNAATEAVTNQIQTTGELQNLETDPSLAAAAISIQSENHNPEKAVSTEMDINTPPQKPKRKKHRPKVITESKPRGRKPSTPKSAASKETPTAKRKYVRRKPQNEASTTPPPDVTGESTDPKPKATEPAKKSCRRALNFNVEGQPGDESSKSKPSSEPGSQEDAGGSSSKSTVHISHGIEVIVENTQAGIAYDLARSVYQKLQDYLSLPEKEAPRTPMPARTNPPRERHATNSQENHTRGRQQLTAQNAQENNMQIVPQTNTAKSPNGFNCSPSTTITTEGKARKSKRKYTGSLEQTNNCIINPVGIRSNAFSTYNSAFTTWPSFQKKRRTDKGQHSASSKSSIVLQSQIAANGERSYSVENPNEHYSMSKDNYRVLAPSSSTNELPTPIRDAGTDLQCHLQTWSCLLKQNGGSTRKRSQGPTRVRKSVLLQNGMTWCKHSTRQVAENSKGKQIEHSHGAFSCVDVLVSEMHKTLIKKKRTTKRVSLYSASSSKNYEQSYGKFLYNHNQFSDKSSITSSKNYVQSGQSEAIWKILVDAITEQLKHLDINKETIGIGHNALVPYSIRKEEQNALVLYRRDGTVIPFHGPFVHIKKQNPRPKVDLDDETNRVWKLLMGNINSEGIDGTDEEKVKWWEEERRVFQGRANSFIARMHLVQGDRRFSQWKGSVVDSVIGVFLTQNVSDHLSSSAFMSLAAHFPLDSKSKSRPCFEEKTKSVFNKPILCIVDSGDTIKSNEMSNQSSCDQNSMTLHVTELDEEKEAVNSNEFSGSSTGIGSGAGQDTCYQSINISTTEITRKICYTIEEKRRSDASSSQCSAVSSQNSVDTLIVQTADREESFSENNIEAEDRNNGSRHKSLRCSFMELLQKAGSPTLHDVNSKGSGKLSSNQNVDSPRMSEVSAVPSGDCHAHTSNSEVTEIESVEILTEETRFSSISKDSGIMAESSSQISDHNRSTESFQDAEKSPYANHLSSNNIQEQNHITIQPQSKQVKDPKTADRSLAQEQNNEIQQSLLLPNLSSETLDIMESTSKFKEQRPDTWASTKSNSIENSYSKGKALKELTDATRKAKIRRVGNEIKFNFDWDALRKEAEANAGKRDRTADTMDSLDYEAVRCAHVDEVADTIKERGMNNMLAARIKDFLNRLVREHGSIDLEWLRDIPPDKAKEYLLSIRGLGLKSVECVRLLTLHHLAFPVDTNVGRIAVRLGWVPLQPLPESLQLHLLELYPVLESIQKYLWPRLCKLDQRTLYELHYQMITFGKVFCTKSKPNCNACPMRGECRHFASAFASARLALPGPEEKGIVSATERRTDQNPAATVNRLLLPQAPETQQSKENQQLEPATQLRVSNCEPIVEEPSSPEPACQQITETDMEDLFSEDPDEIPTIKLNMEEFTQNLQNYMQQNMELQEADMSRALVALTAQAASIPMPKLKNVSRLRTEHQVYELPDSHPLVQRMDKREPDDPCSYLLSIWTPGETADSIQPPQESCRSQEYGKLCDDKTCFSCNSTREANSQIVRGTILIPCRTAMRGSFPLNGTYFQVNEVFADHDSSMNPIDVPRAWIWNLPRRTVYFGTSVPSIFKGLTTEGIQQCFWRGYVCVRGFDQKSRAPRPLIARLHFPASKLARTRAKNEKDQ